MNNYLVYALESSLSLLFLYGIYYLLLRKHSNFLFNRLFILLSLFTSCMTPLLDFSFASSLSIYQIQLEPIIIQAGESQIALSQLFNYSSLFLGIYIWISSLLLIKFIWEIISVLRIKKESSPSFTIFTKERIFLIEDQNFSFFNWIFIRKEDQGHQAIYEHEKSHSQMLHSYDIVFIKLMQVFLWFNPLLFLLERELRLQHEYAVDDALLKKSKNIIAYQQLLLDQVFNVKFSLITNSFNQTFLKNRFTMMTKKENKKWSRLFLIALLSMAIISPAVISCTMETAQDQAEETAVEQSPAQTIEESNNENLDEEKPEDQLFMVVEEMPLFPGGEKAMYAFIAKNIEYPEQAKKEGIQGTVFVEFVVEKDGSITDIKTVRGVSDELDQAAIDVIKSFPNFTPGKMRGKNVRVAYRLPIIYKLQ